MRDIKKNLFPLGWGDKNKGLAKLLMGVFLFFLFIFLANLFSFQIENFFNIASKPIESRLWLAGRSASEFSKSILRAGYLARENAGLRSENQNLLSQINYLQALKKRNEAWVDISELGQNDEFSLVMAGAVGFDGNGELSLNVGSESGIEIGMPVINQQKALFGKITEIYANFSKVMLITNKDSVVNVKVQKNQENESGDGIYGVIKGAGGLSAFLDLAPIDSAINPGDVLVTSSLEGTFPKDLLIGKVATVLKNDQNPHQQAQVQLFLNLNTDNLFVITNYKR